MRFPSSPGAAFEIGVTIVSAEGYEWTDRQRSYWPTNSWISGSVSDYYFDVGGLDDALELAQSDALMRAVLIVRDGRLVVEEYFHGGAQDQSTEVWSVTKSFVSSLIGIALQQGHINSIDDHAAIGLPHRQTSTGKSPEARDTTSGPCRDAP